MAQVLPDSSRWSVHFQQTVIPQGKLHSRSLYTGPNSMTSAAQVAVSLTSTLFLHANLWKGAELEIDPELAGGRGIGQVLGLAGFTNGECFRIGNPEPRLYLARLFLRQTINLPGNGLAGHTRTFSLTAGKFSVADYFDNNRYSHDPRSQFMNWSLMSNGGWDYPANTRGYTVGVVAQLIEDDWVFRLSHTAVPTSANGPVLNPHIRSNYSSTAEIQRTYQAFKYPGIVRMLGVESVFKFLHILKLF